MDAPEGLISLREAARRLGVGCHTIRKLVTTGELRGFRVRTVIRVDPLDLRRYLRSHLVAEMACETDSDADIRTAGNRAI
jgi:excisionase family DNA binding protein